MKPLSHEQTEAIAASFSPCIEFSLTPAQAVASGEKPEGADILVGSIQRRSYPQEPDYYFRGRWMTGREAERLRDAGRKISTKRKTK